MKKDRIQDFITDFFRKITNLPIHETNVDQRIKKIKISTEEASSRLKSILPIQSDKFRKLLWEHLELIEKYTVFCSSPQAVKKAWDLRSTYLTIDDAENILKVDGKLCPNVKKSPLLQYNMKGLMISPVYDGFLLGVRHSEGNYDDQLDDLGRFTYQPPEDLKGMLRYRLIESFSETFGIPYVMFVSMWFSYRPNNSSGNSHFPEELEWLYVVAPVKVISKNDLTAENLNKPLTLQTITRDEFLETICQLKGLISPELEISYRNSLNQNLALEFSYEQIKSSNKGRAIKNWAMKNGKRCPDCETPLMNFTANRIHFGHIISQNWCKSFGFLLDKVHNPDNLYLSCYKCNSSLNDNFPNDELRKKITLSGNGTIGDWLRSHESYIREELKK